MNKNLVISISVVLLSSFATLAASRLLKNPTKTVYTVDGLTLSALKSDLKGFKSLLVPDADRDMVEAFISDTTTVCFQENENVVKWISGNRLQIHDNDVLVLDVSTGTNQIVAEQRLGKYLFRKTYVRDQEGISCMRFSLPSDSMSEPVIVLKCKSKIVLACMLTRKNALVLQTNNDATKGNYMQQN